VLRIARHVPCFAMSPADLGATCALIGATLADHAPRARSVRHTPRSRPAR
jgi:hypothetical protein